MINDRLRGIGCADFLRVHGMAWHGVNRTNIFSLIFLGLPGIGVPMGFWVR
jgi:hypothetical protein